MSGKESALFQRILDAPDDEGPRLDYADGLEPENAPRAEFIRLQCHLEQLAPWDAEYLKVRLRVRELLRGHRKRWAEAVRTLVGAHDSSEKDRTGYDFRRGFLEYVALSSEAFLSKHERLFRIAPIRALHLDSCRELLPQVLACPSLRRLRALEFFPASYGDELGPPDVAQVARCPHLAGLTSLALSANEVGQEGARALAASSHLRALQTLDLSHTGLDDRDLTAFAGRMALPHLSELHLGRNNLGTRGLRSLLAKPWVEQLRTLSLRDTERLPADAVAALASCRRLRSLHSLDLGLCDLGARAADGLAGSPHLGQLVVLDLWGNEIGPRGASALARSAILRSVRQLDLGGGCALGPKGMKALLASASLTDLAWFRLGGNGVGDAPLADLAASPLASGLCHLDLGGNDITDEGIRHLTVGRPFSRLLELNLQGNPVGPPGVLRLIEGVEKLPQLLSLNASLNRGGDPLARAVARCPSVGRLRALRLNQTRITSRGARALRESPFLDGIVTLGLVGNRIGPQENEALRQRFGLRVAL
jgi:uncharacterized protein (TIGR02996 family)